VVALARPFTHAHIFTELGINFSHIRAKSMTVLNPFRRVDERIMDDADLAGPLIFCFCFATFLLFVRVLLPHGASLPAHNMCSLASHSSGISMASRY
jgi:hypothetical protein